MLPKLYINKWLNNIDLRSNSRTFGIADRDYWAWKTKDFANASEQIGLFGYLLYVNNEHFTPFEKVSFIVDAILTGTESIQRSDGSFEEAYPHESSFCVTGLVQFYLLAALIVGRKFFSKESKQRLANIVNKSNKFLEKTPETHGFIANHLMTSFAAQQLYFEEFEQSKTLAQNIVNLLDEITQEGWIKEYDGADPGYQTLFNNYLYLLYLLTNRKYPKLLCALKRSSAFTSLFTFSDGSYSGDFGARGTKVLYPMGFFFDNQNDQFEYLWKEKGMQSLPLFISDGNFGPVMNSWLSYRFLLKKEFENIKNDANYIYLPAAKLLILQNEHQKLVLSCKNGSLKFIDKGADKSIASIYKDKFYSQLGIGKIIKHEKDNIKISLSASKINEPLNTPFKTVVIRLVAITISKSLILKLFFKIGLAKFVMGQQKSRPTGSFITIKWDDQKITTHPEVSEGWEVLKTGFFTHMASANYNFEEINS